MGWWSIDIYWYDDPGEVVRLFRKGDGSGIIPAFVEANWMYAEAAISVNVPALEGMTAEQLERIAVHELMHVLVNEMREGELKHEERVVTTLTKAVFWAVASVEGESNQPPDNARESGLYMLAQYIRDRVIFPALKFMGWQLR